MKSRIKYSIINSSTTMIIYILKILIGFVARSLFIKFLGAEYLGLNGLMVNLLNFLSLAELGIGASIVYELYAPLAKKDESAIIALMQFYRKAYKVIALIVAVLGLSMMPFLHLMIHGGTSISNIKEIFLLFLTNSVMSYLFTYKRSILYADQKNYVVTISDFLFYVILTIFQLYVLLHTKNYILYLILQILFTLLSNLCISKIVEKKYPYLNNKITEKLPQSNVISLKKNVIGNIASQVGTVIVLGSDNVLISGFVGLTAVGLYSNYTLIINAIQSMLQQVTSSVTATVGNTITDNDKEKDYSVFKFYLFIVSSIGFISSLCIYVFINPFITIWLGKNFLLKSDVVVLITINYAFFVYRLTTQTFISAYGLFWQQRWKAIIESFLNVLFSVIFLKVFYLGISGVLLGTLLSTLMVISWYEPYVVFKYGFQRSIFEFAKSTVIFYLKLFFCIFILSRLSNYLVINSVMDFLKIFIIYFPIILVSYSILFWKSIRKFMRFNTSI